VDKTIGVGWYQKACVEDIRTGICPGSDGLGFSAWNGEGEWLIFVRHFFAGIERYQAQADGGKV
jgi:hypothetical protein